MWQSFGDIKRGDISWCRTGKLIYSLVSFHSLVAFLIAQLQTILTQTLKDLLYYLRIKVCQKFNSSEIKFPFMGTRTASPRGRYGERPQHDSVWRYIWKNTTCWPATAHDVTTGVPQYKFRREDTSSAFSSSLTDLFEACKVNTGKSTVFFLLWRALARRLGSVWIRVLAIWHPMTHTTVASFVWA